MKSRMLRAAQPSDRTEPQPSTKAPAARPARQRPRQLPAAFDAEPELLLRINKPAGNSGSPFKPGAGFVPAATERPHFDVL